MRPDERAEALETLQGMSKEEIITWLSGEAGMLFRPPSKSALLSARWQAADRKVAARRDANVLEPGVSAKMDAFARELNQTKDHKEYTAIFERMNPYRIKWDAWVKELKAIGKEEKKVNALWDEYMAQSEIEHPTKPQGQERRSP